MTNSMTQDNNLLLALLQLGISGSSLAGLGSYLIRTGLALVSVGW